MDDITRLKQAESSLRRMTKIFMDAADPILIRDAEGRILDANVEVERVFGWTRDELLGKDSRELLPEEWHALADDVSERLLSGEAVRNVERTVRTKSGELLPVLVTGFRLTDENGQTMAFAHIAKDISQLRQLMDELDRTNRELQQFVSAVTHDLSEPLRAIGGFTEFLRERFETAEDATSREWFGFVEDGVGRMQRMLDDLLEYARLGHSSSSLVDVDCNESVREALANLHAAIEESSAELVVGNLPTIRGNHSMITQLFQNLIGNALKYRGEDAPRVEVASRREDDVWHVLVRDNGIGIDVRFHDVVFDAFRRLHGRDRFEGSGVGLATCRVVVERLGGRIWVESTPDTGSTFHFTVPVASASGR